MTNSRAAAVGLVIVGLTTVVLSLPALADCTCRARGMDFTLGESTCLSTPQGYRRATCGLVLNNTSWSFSRASCDPERISRIPARILQLARHHH